MTEDKKNEYRKLNCTFDDWEEGVTSNGTWGWICTCKNRSTVKPTKDSNNDEKKASQSV